jgi:DNA-binding response OmpR family regulator
VGDFATILVIDDDVTIRLIARRALESFGYLTLVAEDGAAGVRTLQMRAGGVDAILLDLTMPGMSGEDTLRAISAERAATPVIVMSGLDETSIEGYRSEGLIAGFLHKPFTLEHLRAALEDALGLAG